MQTRRTRWRTINTLQHRYTKVSKIHYIKLKVSCVFFCVFKQTKIDVSLKPSLKQPSSDF